MYPHDWSALTSVEEGDNCPLQAVAKISLSILSLQECLAPNL